MTNRSRPTQAKRAREKALQEKRQQKAARRQDAKERKEGAPARSPATPVPRGRRTRREQLTRACGDPPLAFLWQYPSRERTMILFLVFLLVLLWMLGMVTTYTLGGWLHILLVIAVVFLLIRVIRGVSV
jgi:hypothetical protein